MTKIDPLIEALSPGLLDIGARGGADEALLSIARASRVTCFEPDPVEARNLERTGDARWRQFTVLPVAVGGANGTCDLHVPEDSRAASLLAHNPAMVERFGHEHLHRTRMVMPVETMTLDALRAQGKIDRIDFMKIDVEGAELQILEAGKTVLSDCVALKVECSFLSQRLGQPLAWDVMHFMSEAGFEIVDVHDLHRWRRHNLPAHPYRVRGGMEYSRGEVAQCDVIALRSSARLTDLDHALRLIVISAALGFFDYAATVLGEHPDAAALVQRTYGFDLESELRRWSAEAGGAAVRQSLGGSLRALVPLLRAWIGRLPSPPSRSGD